MTTAAPTGTICESELYTLAEQAARELGPDDPSEVCQPVCSRDGECSR